MQVIDTHAHIAPRRYREAIDRDGSWHGLDHVVGDEGVLIVPDRWNDGTNVIAVPADSGFRFAYGPGSFGRHAAEAHFLARSR